VSEDVARVLQTPEVAERLTRQGVDIVYNTPDVFDAVLKADVERNSAILRAAGIGAQ
jgi:tripartite-type tricarboxylate transporter receptor subunit TctC